MQAKQTGLGKKSSWKKAKQQSVRMYYFMFIISLRRIIGKKNLVSGR